MPLVSVLMTAYNRESFIADAIESVLAQTFTDWELIIVDDASTDRTLSIAREYASQDARIAVFSNPSNLGQFPNRNRAAQLAHGHLLKFFDSDDLMYPHCLQIFVACLAAYPQSTIALTHGAREWPGGPCPMLLSPRMCYQRHFLGLGMFDLGPDTWMIRTETFRRLGGFPEDGVASDTLFLFRTCATEFTLLLPGGLFWYRMHPGQELTSSSAKKDYARALRYRWDALNSRDCPLDYAEREQAKTNWCWHLGRSLLRSISRLRFSEVRRGLVYSGLSIGDWLRYFRRQRCSLLAGTPLDSSGNYLVPDWSIYKQAKPYGSTRER